MCALLPLRSGILVLLFGLAAPGLAAEVPPPIPAPMPAPAPPAANPVTQLIGVRSGDHAGYGRIVFDLPPGSDARVGQDPGRLLVQFSGANATVGTVAPPRNVTHVAVASDHAEIALDPDTRIRQSRLADKLIIDVFDAAPDDTTFTTAAPAAPAKAASGPIAPAATSRPTVVAATAAPRPLAVQSSPGTHGSPVDRRGFVPTSQPGPGATPARSQADSSSPTPAQADQIAPPLPPAPAIAVAPLAVSPATPSPQAAPATTETTRPADSRPTPADAPDGVMQTRAEPAADHAPGTPPTLATGGEPIALAAHTAPPPQRQSGKALVLPFGPKAGAAAFRSGDAGTIIFDERRPLDMAALTNDPDFASATVQLLPAATMLRLKLRTDSSLSLVRGDNGWVVTILDGTATEVPASARPIRAETDGARLRLAADGPNAVVSVPAPETGRSLIVGTQTQPGQAVLVQRRLPELALLPTWQGVVVEPASDSVVMRVAGQGFVIASGVDQRSLALAPGDLAAGSIADARRLTRRYDFPSLASEALGHRLQSAVATAAAAAPQARGGKRLGAAQAMIALGLGAEAQALIDLAARDDARLADDPDAIGLRAIAALLAGRMSESMGIDDPRLTGTDEVTLWRGVREAIRDEGSPRAAAVFAATMPLALAYPAPLRERILPLLAEAMVLGGERDAAHALLDSHRDDPALALARGLLAESDGDAPAALQILDRLATGEDRLVGSRAAVAAVETRLKTNAITVAQAADALDKLIYGWRGDAREFALRERVADLRAQAGAWRPALAVLRESEVLWPERHDAIRLRMRGMFDQALATDSRAPLAPLDLIALADENPDLLPDGESGQAMAARLADRLVSLDLPARAVPVLEKLVSAAASGPVKAELGERLASLHLQQGDPTAALVALSESTADPLPAPLLETRTLTYARAEAASGHVREAVLALGAVDSASADDLRATLLETAQDWRGAEQALIRLTQRTVPAEGGFTETQVHVLLRLASAAAQTVDEALLARLRDDYLPRMPEGSATEMFRALTVKPVVSTADLPRSAAEVKLAKGLPAALERLLTDPATPPTRAVAER